MLGDLSLFGDDEPANPDFPQPPPEQMVMDWQIKLIRRALDDRGLITMSARQEAVEREVGRPVSSIRALTSDEALRLLSRLARAGHRKSSTRSDWDERDGDTWIDRL